MALSASDMMNMTSQQTQEVAQTEVPVQIVNLELRELFEERKGKKVDPVIDDIQRRTERVEEGQVADNFEFFYENGKSVEKGTTYHIHYTNDLSVYFMAGSKHTEHSKLIYPTDEKKTEMGYYNSLNKQELLILKGTTSRPTEADYANGSYVRYFAKKANEDSTPVFEVSSIDFESSPLYNFVSLNWYLTGDKFRVYKSNVIEISKASEVIPNINRLLSPFQFYRYGENADITDAINKRLGDMDLSGYNTTTSTDSTTFDDNTSDSIVTLNSDGEYEEGASGVNDPEYDAEGNVINEDELCP